jgi:hypothetical protein
MTSPAPSETATCPRVFIPSGEGEPCSCDVKRDGHGLLHHCPECGVWWSLASETAAS